MPHNSHRSSAITRRLDEVYAMWEDFASYNEAKICWCLINHDEEQMMEAFYTIESSENGRTTDLFLKFESLFNNKEDYGERLYNELMTSAREDGITLPQESESLEQGVPLYWTRLFLDVLDQFSHYIEGLEGSIVIYLSLKIIDDKQKWSDWLQAVLESGIPDKIKFLILDYKQAGQTDAAQVASNTIMVPQGCTALYLLQERYPEKVVRVVPDLDMPLAVKELVAETNQGDPASEFRKSLVDVNNFQATGNKQRDLKEISRLEGKMDQSIDRMGENPPANAEAALQHQKGLLNMKYVKFISVGNAYAQIDSSKAIESFSKASELAYSGLKSGDKGAERLFFQANASIANEHFKTENYADSVAVYDETISKLQESNEGKDAADMIVQALFGKGAALLADKKCRQAAQAYVEITAMEPDMAEATRANVLFEAHRMAGHSYAIDCAEAVKDEQQAWEHNQKAIEIAFEHAALQDNPLLVQLATTQMELAPKVEQEAAAEELDLKMAEIRGPDWKQSA